MNEQIIRIIEQRNHRGMCLEIAETAYEFGTHYVFFINGIPGFHSTDLERVQDYLASYLV